MSKKVYKEDVWKIISEHVGEGNAINQHNIANVYAYYSNGGSVSSREVRKLIRELRQEGYPILSTPHYPNGGYFIPYNYDEVINWRRRMHNKAVKLLAIINPVLHSCNNIFPERNGIEQLNMFEEVS